MALNLKENQELYLIFEDGHEEKVIDGFVTTHLSIPFAEDIVCILTEQGYYKYVSRFRLSSYNPAEPFSIDSNLYKEETWYIFNDSKHDYVPIHGVRYEIKEKENDNKT